MRGIEPDGQFGVYVLTYPGDFHLSRVLIRSIRHLNPGVPVMIIPGEGFEREAHPFDVPVMPVPDGRFWPTLARSGLPGWRQRGRDLRCRRRAGVLRFPHRALDGCQEPEPVAVLQRPSVPHLCPAVVVRRPKEGLLARPRP